MNLASVSVKTLSSQQGKRRSNRFQLSSCRNDENKEDWNLRGYFFVADFVQLDKDRLIHCKPKKMI
jgi:hypothetical protein